MIFHFMVMFPSPIPPFCNATRQTLSRPANEDQLLSLALRQDLQGCKQMLQQIAKEI